MTFQNQSVASNCPFDLLTIEKMILELAEFFDIRIVWDKNAAIVTTVCTIVGGVIGAYAGGTMAGVLGAGVGGAAGFAAYTLIPLREIWETVKEELKALLYIVYNYLREMHPDDYIQAFKLVMACTESRQQCVYLVIDFIAHILRRKTCIKMPDINDLGSGEDQATQSNAKPIHKVKPQRAPGSTEKDKLKGTHAPDASSLKNTRETQSLNDKTEPFLALVAVKYKQYSPRTKAIVEHRIHNILFEADMGLFDESPSTANTVNSAIPTQ